MDSILSWAILSLAALGGGAWLLAARCSYLGQSHAGFNPCPGANSIYNTPWQKYATGEGAIK